MALEDGLRHAVICVAALSVTALDGGAHFPYIAACLFFTPPADA